MNASKGEQLFTLNVKYSNNSSVLRHLFIKEDNSKDSNPMKPITRTLVVMNIPPFVDHHCIRHLFKDCGKITDVFFNSTSTYGPKVKSKYFDKNEEKTNGYKVCYVVFSSQSSVKKALNLSKNSKILSLKPESDLHSIGLKAMKIKYNDSIVDSKDLQKEINEFISDFDKKVEDQRLRAKESDGIPDADGWIKVNRHSKKKSLPNDYSNDEKIVEKHNKKRKKTSNDLNNFYAFKVKESKIEYLMQLRNKFENDKQKLALIKAQRKFKPF